MIDLEEIWDDIAAARPPGFPGRFVKALTAPPIVLKNPVLFYRILQPAAITIRKCEEYGNFFELHPNPATAHPKAWVWVLAVRSGAFAKTYQYRDSWRAGKSFAPSPGDAPGDDMVAAFHADALHKSIAALDIIIKNCREDFASLARHENFLGDNIEELVALSADCTKVLGRFSGNAPVIGYPVTPQAMGFEHKIRLFRNVSGWLENLCAGAVLIGEAEENLSWLQACDHGIITDNIAHGDRIQKLLRRPYVGPQVLVAS